MMPQFLPNRELPGSARILGKRKSLMVLIRGLRFITEGCQKRWQDPANDWLDFGPQT